MCILHFVSVVNHEVSSTSPVSIVKINVLSWALEISFFLFPASELVFGTKFMIGTFFIKSRVRAYSTHVDK